MSLPRPPYAWSSPRPPFTRSRSGPPLTTSSPLSPSTRSLPPPPYARSAPVPPITSSRPLPPQSRSLPPPPRRMSFAPRPRSRSFPPSPQITSRPRVPTRTSWCAVPVIVQGTFASAPTAVTTMAVTEANPSARLAMRTRRMIPPSRLNAPGGAGLHRHTASSDGSNDVLTNENRGPFPAPGPRWRPSSDVPPYRTTLTFAFTTSVAEAPDDVVIVSFWTAPILAVLPTLTTTLIDFAVAPEARFWTWYVPRTTCFVTSFLPT